MLKNKKPKPEEIVCAHGNVSRKEIAKCRELFGDLLTNGELCIACDVVTKIINEKKRK